MATISGSRTGIGDGLGTVAGEGGDEAVGEGCGLCATPSRGGGCGLGDAAGEALGEAAGRAACSLTLPGACVSRYHSTPVAMTSSVRLRRKINIFSRRPLVLPTASASGSTR